MAYSEPKSHRLRRDYTDLFFDQPLTSKVFSLGDTEKSRKRQLHMSCNWQIQGNIEAIAVLSILPLLVFNCTGRCIGVGRACSIFYRDAFWDVVGLPYSGRLRFQTTSLAARIVHHVCMSTFPLPRLATADDVRQINNRTTSRLTVLIGLDVLSRHDCTA